jgi:hypothetical protein
MLQKLVTLFLFSLFTQSLYGQNTEFVTCGRKLMKDGRNFYIRGVNYSPTPIGESAGVDFLLRPPLWQRDLPLLRDMHANAIKVYYYNPNGDHTPFLDLAYNGGVNSIYTVFMVWIFPWFMEDTMSINDPAFQKILSDYRTMAMQTGTHPGTMGYSIGGEINFHPTVQSPIFWQKFNAICGAVRDGLGTVGAKKILTTTLIDDGGTTQYLGESFGAAIDIWGTDIYRGNVENIVLPAYRSIPGGKPIIFSEYGMSFASNFFEASADDTWIISNQLAGYSMALEKNFEGLDTVGEQIIVGGFIFAFTDEWWKDGNWWTHDFGTAPNQHYVLGINSEEYYGLYAIEKHPVPGEVDILKPRPIVGMLRDIWARSIDGQYIEGCSPPTPAPTTTAPPTLAPLPSPEAETLVPAPSTLLRSDSSSDSGSFGINSSNTSIPSSSSSSGWKNVKTVIIPPCYTSRNEKTAGLAAFYDATCVNNTKKIGCQKNGCRFCKMFTSKMSDPFDSCPMSTVPVNTIPQVGSESKCKADTFTCSSGLVVSRDPERNCSFMSCPQVQLPEEQHEVVCDPGAGNLNIGINMYFDESCVTNGGAGCDPNRLGCRFCRESSSGNAAYLPCPSTRIISSQQNEQEDADQATCSVSIGNANAGINMVNDPSCITSGGIGCAADQPGCRFCQARMTWQSQNLISCTDTMSTTSTGEEVKASRSAASAAMIACSVIVGVVFAVIISVVAYKVYNKKRVSHSTQQRSSTRATSVHSNMI